MSDGSDDRPRSEPAMGRRALLGLTPVLAAVAVSALARDAKAAPPPKPAMTVNDWLVRAALLLDETKRAQDWVGAHPSDADLAQLAYEIAEVRSTAAARIPAPAAVKAAHMHLLMVLESTTASFDATARGDWKRAAQFMTSARTEERTLNAALDAAKVKIPSLR